MSTPPSSILVTLGAVTSLVDWLILDWLLIRFLQPAWIIPAGTDAASWRNRRDIIRDALGFPIHLDNFLTMLTRYPDMRVVIDHCMKPRIRDHAQGPEVFQNWADGMSRLADQTGAYCKFSGLVTEANADWSIQDIRPYANHVLSNFGADRVMWGSDWPVCRLRASYDTWFATAQTLTSDLSSQGRERIFGGSAADFYRLDV